MATYIEEIKQFGISKLPERLEQFYHSEIDRYIQDYYRLEEAPYFFEEDTYAWLDFSIKEVKHLMKVHKEMLGDESEENEATYIPLAAIDDTIDFFVVDIDNEHCPVYYGDCEDGTFKLESKSLTHFLEFSIVKEDVNL